MTETTAPDPIDLSWNAAMPMLPRLATVFNGRTLELRPELNTTLPAGKAERDAVFMAILEFIGQAIADPDKAADSAAPKLAQENLAHGITAEMYPDIGAALIWSMSALLAANWTPETAEAWTTYFVVIADWLVPQEPGKPAPKKHRKKSDTQET